MAMNKKLFITPIYSVLRLDVFSLDKYLSETHNEYTSTIYKELKLKFTTLSNLSSTNFLLMRQRQSIKDERNSTWFESKLIINYLVHKKSYRKNLPLYYLFKKNFTLAIYGTQTQLMIQICLFLSPNHRTKCCRVVFFSLALINDWFSRRYV